MAETESRAWYAYGQLYPVIIVLQLAVRDYVSQTYELDVSSGR